MEPRERPPAPPPNNGRLLDRRIWGATPRIKNRHVPRLDLPADLRGQRCLAPGCYLRQLQIRCSEPRVETYVGQPSGAGPIKSPITIPRYLVFAAIVTSAIIKGAWLSDRPD